MTLAKFYGKIFGLGAVMGMGLEAMLIKSNYYQVLAASEAKQKRKELEQEREDLERLQRLKQA
ncbi:hypothetical protein BCR43DRAFT_486813 [Syncephalastrum racemosum]|uniref:Uncharacterized protein n=1 Tax=Syncephalastrum racemosum TaxID=13706 RepID=A0A1X2HPQ4_SYNRA|nr:hypothetical protein BCR43DRAFT_486813 [Syncephalastrum racemosum]